MIQVRNAFEHYDEHLDSRLVGGAERISDWYITDQIVLRTPDGVTPSAVGLRVFFAPGGILYFEDEELHLFELEVELIQLRRKVAEQIREARSRIEGRGKFGAHVLKPLMSDRKIKQRYEQWQHARAEALESLGEEKAIGGPGDG